MWRRALFDVLFRIGRPIWDTPTPPEVRDAVEGPSALPPGRALDVGCGTSPNVAYLAQHGWVATGVDFSPKAIQLAKRKAAGIPGAAFLEADVTKLSASGIAGPFDLVIDNGCYHSLSSEGRAAYVPEVAALMKPGALLMMWEGIMVADNEIPDRFQDEFAIERIEHKSFPIQRLGLKFAKKNANWYWLRRLGEDEGGLQT
ncbi:MAG TPA: class I SAM-dependent methyltransferase [Mycobacterium sp.]|uniref:class I SAM-dependent methyltransferase n=1 Tax=Mycobacterium sp. TaxID=1785 RepID=UPI002C7A7FE0|nr:class I SAM-dependent methyltransferase [Mycobacterium sp.]HME77430.1 class I SAM-dependent methyltransferase [Mycobacterium sp.]